MFYNPFLLIKHMANITFYLQTAKFISHFMFFINILTFILHLPIRTPHIHLLSTLHHAAPYCPSVPFAAR